MRIIRATIFGLLGLFVLATTPSPAMAIFVTTINWNTSSFPPVLQEFDRAVMEWSGVDGDFNDKIAATELQEWVLKIVNTTTSSIVFTDIIVASGVVQPVGGVTRPVSDIRFLFNLSTNILEEWDNDFDLLQEDDASGTTFNLFGQGDPFFPFVGISQWIEGERVDEAITLFREDVSQSTVLQVPEPGTLALFGVGLAGLGFARRRRSA